jgi:hypothetical protein
MTMTKTRMMASTTTKPAAATSIGWSMNEAASGSEAATDECASAMAIFLPPEWLETQWE